MPFYQYTCKSCNNDTIYDILKSIKDETPELCPICNGELSRMFGVSILKFSGNGWSKDGYSSIKKSESKGETE